MSEKVSFKELVQQIARQSRQSESSTNNFIHELVKIIEKGLRESGTVSISGFGKFELRSTKPAQLPDPATGERVSPSVQNRVVFKPFKNLRDEVNQPFAALTARILKEADENFDESGEAVDLPGSGDVDQQSPAAPGSESVDDLLIEHENPRFSGTGGSVPNRTTGLAAEDGSDRGSSDLNEDPGSEGDQASHKQGVAAASLPLSDMPEEKALANEVQKAGTFRWSYAAAAIVAILVFIILFFLYQQYQEASDRPSQAMSGNQDQPLQTETLTPADGGSDFEAGGTESQDGQSGDASSSEDPAQAGVASASDADQESDPSASESSSASASQTTAPTVTNGTVQSGITPAAADATQTRFDTESFSVEPGQSLWTIAESQLGNPYLWPVLYHLNQDKLENPNFLPADSDILLPSISDPDNLNEFEREQVARGYFDLYEWNRQHSPEEARFFLWAVGVFSANLLDQPPSDVNQEDLDFARNR